MKSSENKGHDLSNIRVLVVEDDPIQMMIAEKILQLKNAIVLKASNGYEAVKLLNEGCDADIALLDLEMPEMDGYTALIKIKELLPSMPVIALTAHLLDRNMQASLLEKGFKDSISKPYKPETFYSKILVALKKETA